MNDVHVPFTSNKLNGERLDEFDTRKVTKLDIKKYSRPVEVLNSSDVNTENLGVFGCLRGNVFIPVGIDLTLPVLDESLLAPE